jgi:hypothetical protein
MQVRDPQLLLPSPSPALCDLSTPCSWQHPVLHLHQTDTLQHISIATPKEVTLQCPCGQITICDSEIWSKIRIPSQDEQGKRKITIALRCLSHQLTAKAQM